MSALSIFHSRSIYLSVIVVLVSFTGACAAPRILRAIDGLSDRSLYVINWSIASNDTVSLLLTAMGEYGPLYTAYAALDHNGNIIVGPDDIYRNVFVRRELVLFGADGKMFAYETPEEWRDLFICYEYDPNYKKFSSSEFTDPPLGRIMAAGNLQSLGNVLFGISWSQDSPYMIVIHDVNKDTFLATNIDIGEFSSSADMIRIIGLPGDKLLISGTAPFRAGRFSLCYMVYDMKGKTVIWSEEIPLDSLAENGALKFSSPGPAQIFKHDETIFYLALGKRTWDSPDSTRYDSYLIQFDQNGKVLDAKDMVPLQIRESDLTGTPKRFILLRDKKFWLMSLAEFPVIKIDRGTSDK